MDIATMLGLIIAVVGVLAGMVVKGVPLDSLANPAALLVILAGTVGAVVLATPMERLSQLPKLFGKLFGSSGTMKQKDAVDTIVELAELTRKEGILALETRLPSVKDPFIVNGLKLLIDGADSNYVAEVLSEDISAMEERHAANAQIFTQAGTYAPTLGVLGAVMGLIAALTELSDTEALGHAISAAFVATLLGIFTGYVLWHPFANKLKQKSRQEATIRRLMVEGILGICEGQNPRMIEDRMLSQLGSGDRAKIARQ